jgi:hypothetical protein
MAFDTAGARQARKEFALASEIAPHQLIPVRWPSRWTAAQMDVLPGVAPEPVMA